MNEIKLKYGQGSLNKIESFVEEICDEFNIGDTFLGNILIAVTEMVNIIEGQKSDVTISFLSESQKFLFKFYHFSKRINFQFFEESTDKNQSGENEFQDSLFMINALCDDLILDKNENLITLSFLNVGVDENISMHRKKYLNNYLNQRIKV